jgi:hypothetical protein
VRDRPPQRLALGERQAAECGGDAHDVLLVEEDALRLGERGAQALVRVDDGLQPAPAAAERFLHAGLGGPGAHQRHRGHGVLERARPQHAQQVAHGRGLELEAVERVARRDGGGGDGVVVGDGDDAAAGG